MPSLFHVGQLTYFEDAKTVLPPAVLLFMSITSKAIDILTLFHLPIINYTFMVSAGGLWWTLWISLCYATATATVCRDSVIATLTRKVLHPGFSSLQHMFFI